MHAPNTRSSHLRFRFVARFCLFFIMYLLQVELVLLASRAALYQGNSVRHAHLSSPHSLRPLSVIPPFPQNQVFY